MKIEIITTPNEALKETGFGTLKACHSILNSIKKVGHIVDITICKTVSDLENVKQRKPDLVLLAVKYLEIEDGENIYLSKYFEENKINFSGSFRDSIKFDSDKVLAKSHLKSKGVNTAKYFTAVPKEYKRVYDLPVRFPLFLKPIDAANGNGIDDLSFVNNFDEFEKKVASLYERFAMPVLVEEYLDGPEFTTAIIKKTDGELLVAALEVIPLESKKGLRILGEKAKQDDTEKLRKIEDSKLKESIIKLAIDVFIDLDIRDFGRIDIKTNKSGICFFMEANLVPGMTYGSSYFPKAFEIEHSLDYDSVIKLIVDEGISRVSRVIEPIIKYVEIDCSIEKKVEVV